MSAPLAESAQIAADAPLAWAAALVGAYLVGSIPTAHLLAQRRGVDLGQVGSKSYGATNLGRTLGRTWGILCFLIDALKGAIPVLVIGWLIGALGATPGSNPPATAWLWLATATSAIVGHTLSPWIGFKGGKGVATGFGALAAMWPVLTLPAALALVLWCVLVLLFRMVSLSSMVAAVSVPCSVAVAAVSANGLGGVRDAVPYLAISALIAFFVVWKHRANIARIRAGTESKVLQKKPANPAPGGAGGVKNAKDATPTTETKP
ncbi:MAG: glycerol-3-phosphate 1-O-acyltransferase PlsY [bacterium]